MREVEDTIFDDMNSTDGWQTELVSNETEDILKFKLLFDGNLIVSKDIATIYSKAGLTETDYAKAKGKQKMLCFLLDAIAVFLNGGGEIIDIEELVGNLTWVDKCTLDYRDWFVINLGYTEMLGQIHPFLEFQNVIDPGFKMCWVQDVYIDFGLVDD